MKTGKVLFWRKKCNSKVQPIKDQAAQGIARILLSVQTKFSDFMNTITKHISTGTMKILLVVFCLLGGAFSLYIIAEAILKSDNRQSPLKIDQVDVPKHYHKAGDEELMSDQFVDEETFQKIESFENYMDSLPQTETGKKIHDSILINRPGLMDSVRMLREIYQSQTNK